MKTQLFLVIMSCSFGLIGQDSLRKIVFPDVEGYHTLKTDLHIHTVFSDGSVWPNIRVQEAVKDGLDAIAITEHLEYQPHSADIPHPDRNRSYEIASNHAKAYDLLIIPGAEITRSLPPGHSNALFVQDANKLLIEDSLAVFEEARRQDCFVFWNHPDWIQQQEDGIPVLTTFHKLLLERNLLHGVEVVNDLTYSAEALQMALDNDMVPLGTSDIHGLIDYQFRVAEGGHRPISLVFAKERSVESIKEALFAGRTLAWFKNLLVGKEVWISELLKASVSFTADGYIGPSSVVQVNVKNNSDASWMLKNESKYTFQRQGDIVTVPPRSEMKLHLKTLTQEEKITLDFTVLNTATGKNKNAKFQVDIPILLQND